MEATQLSNTEGSPGSPSASSAPSRLKINKAYLKNAKGKRGHVYGLGSAQYREQAPSSRDPNGLARNLEMEMRVGGLETSLNTVTADVAGVKHAVAELKEDVSQMRQDFASTRDAINEFLQTLRPQQATGQTSAQPQSQLLSLKLSMAFGRRLFILLFCNKINQTLASLSIRNRVFLDSLTVIFCRVF
ncbi:uncharacterized protein LOC108834014 [Raphanus sativus]|uniref:Uncharacterized protein LOC108834014 n=1 Tax=Raphanus sativus TaxID=3726 RepID=A0A6J0LRH3_RAPSA|nr:uncharacterized protein LOC108834014 [Raphanus sativus]